MERIPFQTSCDYFHSRPKNSQIGAVVSRQSTPVPNRDVRTNTASSSDPQRCKVAKIHPTNHEADAEILGCVSSLGLHHSRSVLKGPTNNPAFKGCTHICPPSIQWDGLEPLQYSLVLLHPSTPNVLGTLD